MGEVRRGRLRNRRTKRVVRTCISYQSRKGKPIEQPLRGAAQVAEGVRAAVEAGQEVDVDFEFVDNQIDRVRAAGEPWSPPKAKIKPAKPGERFHNPYNFVRFDGPVPNDGLAQARPPGHHVYGNGLFEGRIEVELTAASPLLLLDPTRTEAAGNGHKTVDLLEDSDGRPVLRPTSLKGALRSAYEAITGSRLGVFQDHDRPLARRMAARDGLAMMPARISDRGDQLELYLGGHAEFPAWDGERWSVPGNTMYAAWLPRYWPGGRKDSGPVIDPRKVVRYPDGSLPEHRDHVVCWLNLVRRTGRPQFKYWRVVHIQPSTDGSPGPSEDEIRMKDAGWGRQNHDKTDEYRLAEGYVCVTNQNIGRKHDERVFFILNGTTPTTVALDERWCTAWNHLVENYQTTHEHDLDKRKKSGQTTDAYLGREPGKTAWSRHVYTKTVVKLGPGDLCYARVDHKANVVGLYPVMISRELATRIPQELLPQRLRPAESLDELSPADRVFGWVRQGRDDAQDAHARNAYKGHLRIRRITCETPTEHAVHRFEDDGLPLAILSTPKPQQALFYAAGASDWGNATRLSGRKFYLHHRGVPDDYWNPDGATAEANDANGGPQRLNGGFYREYVRRQGRDVSQRDSQNRSIRAWVKEQTRFSAEIRFDNLNDAELGALLWLCALGENRYLKLGAGKPLGFGSVTAKVTEVEIRDHAAKQAEYAVLVPTGSTATDGIVTCPKSAVDRFVKAFEDAFCQQDGRLEDHPAIAAFLAMAEGPGDGAPIHYPRIRQDGDPEPVPPDARGENYRWFVKNKRRLPAPGCSGLPYQQP